MLQQIAAVRPRCDSRAHACSLHIICSTYVRNQFCIAVHHASILIIFVSKTPVSPSQRRRVWQKTLQTYVKRERSFAVIARTTFLMVVTRFVRSCRILSPLVSVGESSFLDQDHRRFQTNRALLAREGACVLPHSNKLSSRRENPEHTSSCDIWGATNRKTHAQFKRSRSIQIEQLNTWGVV